jgi:hypothetical protein
MASDYTSIRAGNVRRYGTDIGRIGPMLLADRYDDRTHFIFELLQNTEDALARRCGGSGPRSATFHLTESQLIVSHFGRPFDEADVRGICGIAESTKDLTAIGHFGIGFKSVYAFTDRPEVHSGVEGFAIESFVWPVAAPSISKKPNETVILIPLKQDDPTGRSEIAAGLERLGPSALLFLREIEEVHWSVAGGRSGLYLRQSDEIDADVRRVTVIGQERDEPEVDEEWMVFSRAVAAGDGRQAGHVELAFSLGGTAEHPQIVRVTRSPLVVYFPTVLETHLGFLVQGPYRTTPSRDNVPRSDTWNQRLVSETRYLLVDALRWLRDRGDLNTAALRCLPLDSTKFSSASMFAPLFHATKSALTTEELIPRADAGYIAGDRALLARTQEVRELIAPAQLAALYGADHELAWASADITQDRAPELRRYLMQELGVGEVTPDTVAARLSQAFLRGQPDDWILKLYEFLSSQPSLRRRLVESPLIRLESGAQVHPYVNGQPQAFLPGAIATSFPTVRAAVCATETAREFLRSLGLTEPDPVDDVIRNILPKYRQDDVDVDDAQYEADVHRMLAAFATDSKARREKLVAALRETSFVRSIDAGGQSKRISKPSKVYFATERLKQLFAGIEGVMLVDDEYACLRGEDMRELLEACGAARHLQPIPADDELAGEERREIRRQAGLERSSWENPIADVTLRGLNLLLSALPQLAPHERRHRAELLWDALADVEGRRGSRVFAGQYTWGYSHQTKTAPFDAAFVRVLNKTAWVPDKDGELQGPEFVLFDSLSWKPNPFLQSRIRFKPPLIEALAREAGIDPGVLDLLKKHGVTSVAELMARLGLAEDDEEGTSVDGELGDEAEDGGGEGEEGGAGAVGGTGGIKSTDGRGGTGGGGKGTGSGGGGRRDGAPTGKNAKGHAGARGFISYVAVHADDEEPDPDGLSEDERMALEELAIRLILAKEPHLRRTPSGNPGYDLFEADDAGEPIRWVEVKAMRASLDDRPVGLSHTQFEHARSRGTAYWIYVVEYAADETQAVIVRICDPAGKSRTFTFDHGWKAIAEPG